MSLPMREAAPTGKPAAPGQRSLFLRVFPSIMVPMFLAVIDSSNPFGPVAGGYLTQHLGWRSIFLINLPLGIVALFLTLRLEAKPGFRSEHRFDLTGLLLFVGFVAPTLLALQQIQHAEVRALPAIAALTALGLVSLALLLRQERRAPFPLLPIGLLRQPAIWRSDALAACHGAALVSLITLLPIYLRVARGASASETGV